KPVYRRAQPRARSLQSPVSSTRYDPKVVAQGRHWRASSPPPLSDPRRRVARQKLMDDPGLFSQQAVGHAASKSQPPRRGAFPAIPSSTMNKTRNMPPLLQPAKAESARWGSSQTPTRLYRAIGPLAVSPGAAPGRVPEEALLRLRSAPTQPQFRRL